MRSVSIVVGAIALTVIWCSASSSASARVRFTTPPFDAEYATRSTFETKPYCEAMLTIRPGFRASTIRRAAACDTKKRPLRFVSMT